MASKSSWNRSSWFWLVLPGLMVACRNETELSDIATVEPGVTVPQGTIGYVGCSMTMGGRDGYVLAKGKHPIWPLLQYGGGQPDVWAKDLTDTSPYWAAFGGAVKKTPPALIWWQLCTIMNDSSDITAATKVLGEIHRRAPGVPIYVSAQPSYNPTSHACPKAGLDGPSRMSALATQIVALKDPLVSAGPVVGPLAYPAEVVSDGCHQNNAGKLANGKQLSAFFDAAGTGTGTDAGTGTGTDAGTGTGTPAGQARGIYVVDDGDADFNTALNKSFVDGALVRTGWSAIEKTEGTYNFTTLCSKVTAAHAVGKMVSLVNFATAPSWLLPQLPAGETWSHPQYGTQPVPWSSLAQQKMQAWVTAESEFACDGYKLKEHPAIAQIDTSILGMQSIRQAPTATLSQLTDAVNASVNIWYSAFGATGHNFYVGLFPLGSSTADAITIRDAVQAQHPNHHWFQETWTGAGPSGSLATPLDPNAATRKFFVMLQACGYWSNQTRIKCSFSSSTDEPLTAYNNVAADFQAKYLEIYPDDLNTSAYESAFETIHDLVWR